MPTLLDRDFKTSTLQDGSKPAAVRRHRRSITLAVAGFAVIVVLASTGESEIEAKPLPARAALLDERLIDGSVELPIPAPQDAATSSDTLRTGEGSLEKHVVEVERGDTLSAIFDRFSISQAELLRLVADEQAESTLRLLRPGDELTIELDGERRLQTLVHAPSPHDRSVFTRTDTGFDQADVSDPIETRIQYAHGVIKDSLFNAATRAGLTDNLTMELATIFGWDIDFALDVRSGDEFTLVYETRHKRGERIGYGAILAAEFINQGKRFRALRYRDPNGQVGYFTPDGNSVRKAFLRTPVDFARISSRFSSGRKHPVLNKMRAHRGVDYAAPTGTPVRSTGDGKIEFMGRKGGYGKVIIVRHTSTYATLYAHLSKFRRGMRTGKRVSQGQVIGSVGQTGLATGPHLHYEFRVNGVQRNPLTIKLPGAKPVASAFREDFSLATAPLLAQLETLDRNRLILASDSIGRLD